MHQGHAHHGYDILKYVAGGMTEAQLTEDFPVLRPENVQAALAFTALEDGYLAMATDPLRGAEAKE